MLKTCKLPLCRDIEVLEAFQILGAAMFYINLMQISYNW